LRRRIVRKLATGPVKWAKHCLALVVVLTAIAAGYTLSQRSGSGLPTTSSTKITTAPATHTTKLTTAPCPISETVNIAVYGESESGGVTYLSLSWVMHFLEWWKSGDPTLSYVILDTADIVSDCHLGDYPNLMLYIEPGGDAYKQQRELGSAGKNNILDFIDNHNGAFLGICAGFYYASNGYLWYGTFYNHTNLLHRFPTVEGPVTEIADWYEPPGYAITHLSNGLNTTYWGGPTRGYKETPVTVPGVVKATFTSIPKDLPAVVRAGKMLLTSVHLEAFENDGISGLSTSERVQNYIFLANLINELLESNYHVPQSAGPLQQLMKPLLLAFDRHHPSWVVAERDLRVSGPLLTDRHLYSTVSS
jgi:glutamine amidotransferase-like uncharacterized protein